MDVTKWIFDKQAKMLLCYLAINTFLVTDVLARSYEIPNDTDLVIGEIRIVIADRTTTLLDIGRKHGFGYEEMKLLNPEVDTWMPDNGQRVRLPASFVLPDTIRQGIVLNIPEMRLYYYHPVEEDKPARVDTYPLGVGREGWGTPYTQTYIINKKEHPTWRPPESFVKNMQKQVPHYLK